MKNNSPARQIPFSPGVRNVNIFFQKQSNAIYDQRIKLLRYIQSLHLKNSFSFDINW